MKLSKCPARSAALLAPDWRGGRHIFWTIEYDAEAVAIYADDLERRLGSWCTGLMHDTKLIMQQD